MKKLALFLLSAAALYGQTDAGEKIFSSSCAACHSLDGRGGGHAPNIAAGSAAQSYSDDRIAAIVHNGIPSGGMPSFSSLSSAEIQEVVKHLRGLQASGSSPGGKGNPVAGRALFFGKGDCSSCHMAEGKGGFIASDLTKTRLSPQALRDGILQPSRKQNDRLTTLTLRNGQKVTGLVRNEDNFSLQLQDTAGAFYSVQKSSVQSMESQPKPFMPTDYGTRLSADELNDLLAYLESLRSKS
jgi:cytochrome c oxidase cbb3-type subunit III